MLSYILEYYASILCYYVSVINFSMCINNKLNKKEKEILFLKNKKKRSFQNFYFFFFNKKDELIWSFISVWVDMFAQYFTAGIITP